MKKFLITLALAISAFSASADDTWTGKDKGQHLVAGAVIASGTTLVTKNEWYGFAAGCGAGAAKELYDREHRDKHTASFKDFAVTCLGAGLAAGGTKFFLVKDGSNTRVIYNIRF